MNIDILSKRGVLELCILCHLAQLTLFEEISDSEFA